MKILVIKGTSFAVAECERDSRTNTLFRPIGNLVSGVNSTAMIGEAFETAPLRVNQGRYSMARDKMKRGVQITPENIVMRDNLSEEEQIRLLSELWNGKPVEGFN